MENNLSQGPLELSVFPHLITGQAYHAWTRLRAIMSPLENFQEYRKLVRTIDAPTLLCLGPHTFLLFNFLFYVVHYH